MIKPIKRSLASIIPVLTALNAGAAVAQETDNQSQPKFEIEEVIVTAQRRSQSIQEVANSIEALSGTDLDDFAKVGFEDYVGTIGGAGFTRSGSGSVKLGMRGVSPIGQTDQFAFSQTVSTVGVYLDDVAVQGAGALPDLNLYDMQRVEVLKGPQGTLYGEGAMGGAIKMILNKPNLYEFEAKGEITALSTAGADWGHRVRGAVSIPLIEGQLAARIVGSTEAKKGWIDNIATGEDGVNDTDSMSLRASVLAEFSDEFSAELLIMHDQQEIDAFGEETIGLSENKTDILDDQFNDVELDLYALTLKYDFGFAEFTSITSYLETERYLDARVSLSIDEFFVPFILAPEPPFGFGLGFAGLPLGFSDRSILTAYDASETFSQELRLVSSGDNVIDWTVGLFYRDRERDGCSSFDSPALLALNDYLPDFFFLDLPPTTIDCPATPASGLDSTGRIAKETFEQQAIYGEINWEVADNLELTLGARLFDEEVTLEEDLQTAGVFLVFGFASPPTANESDESDVLFKLGLSWTPNPDQMYYFNVAEGFRSGGSNLQASRTFEPERFRSYDSDSLINYELGAKTTWLNGKLNLNGAIFYSDWSDIQTAISVPTIDSAAMVLTPGGDAEVLGIDLNATYLVSDQFITGLSITAQRAEFTDTIAEANIVEDSDLPNSPELTASMYAQYTQYLDDGELFARLEYRFVDDQRSVVEPLAPYVAPLAFGNPSAIYDDNTTILPSYDIVNLTVGLRKDDWYVTAYVNNLLDEHYLLNYGYAQSFLAEGANPTLGAVGLPRTIGLTAGINF